MSKKRLVYAEDILYAIMQHPSRNITKGLVKQIVEQVVAEKEVTVSCEDLASERVSV